MRPGSRIVEVNTGLGMLKEHLPTEYQQDYVSIDLSNRNLRAGRNRGRDMSAIQAMPNHLPLPSNSVDCVIGLDSFDSIDNIPDFLWEARSVLRSDGALIHVQLSYLNEDILFDEFHDNIIIPPLVDRDGRRMHTLIVNTRDLSQAIAGIHDVQQYDYWADL